MPCALVYSNSVATAALDIKTMFGATYQTRFAENHPRLTISARRERRIMAQRHAATFSPHEKTGMAPRETMPVMKRTMFGESY